MAEDRSERPTGVDTASVLAGARPTVRLNLRLEVGSERAPEVEALLPEHVSEKLAAQQEKVLRWIGKGRENQASLLTDPVDALAKAGVDLDPGEIAALRRRHPPRRTPATLPPSVDLASFSVKAGPRPKSASARRPSNSGQGPKQ